MNQDKGVVTARVRWELKKFDGDPPLPGEHKEPVEIIRGGDDIPTEVVFKKERKDGTD